VTEGSRLFVRLIRELHVSHCCRAADGLCIEYIVGMQLMYWVGLFGTTLYDGGPLLFGLQTREEEYNYLDSCH